MYLAYIARIHMNICFEYASWGALHCLNYPRRCKERKNLSQRMFSVYVLRNWQCGNYFVALQSSILVLSSAWKDS